MITASSSNEGSEREIAEQVDARFESLCLAFRGKLESEMRNHGPLFAGLTRAHQLVTELMGHAKDVRAGK